MRTITSSPTGDKLSTCPVKDYRGETFAEATLYRSRFRFTGRRVVVRGPGGAILFDSDDHVDLGNALDSLDWWLIRHLGPSPELAARFEGGWIPTGPSKEAEANKVWKAHKDAGPTDVVQVEPLTETGIAEAYRDTIGGE
jgi:hypothetical protein